MRRRSRECALQILYQLDVGKELEGRAPPNDLERVINEYWTSFESDIPVDRALVDRLVRGVVRELEGLDRTIAEKSHHWRVGRMSAVDRNLIRLAAYEI